MVRGFMIISHRHQFIFIKTHKTAGTSIEIALSRFCGPDDVITAISSYDEMTRRQLGYPGPQNTLVPRHKHSWLESFHTARTGTPTRFYNHAGASYIRKHIETPVWDSYFKFCFERNPWDKAVSLYYWRDYSRSYATVADFIRSRKARRIRDWKMYADGSGIVVDRVYKYEDMTNALADIRDRLNLPQTPTLPDAKGGHRGDKRHYRELLADKERDRIARLCAPEIAHFNYAWA